MTPDDFDRRPSDEGVEPGEAEQEGVRRLLAAAYDPVSPMPEDVARRLDDVLDGLLAQRADPSVVGADSSRIADSSPVADLAERRARRWPRVLVAAVAVSVLGLGIGNVMGEMGSVESSDTTASRGAGDAGGRSRPSPEDSRSEALSDLEENGPEPAPLQNEQSAPLNGDVRAKALPDLRSESLTDDAQAVADFSLGYAPPPEGDWTELRECAVPATEHGDELVVVRLDGEIAIMAFRAAENGLRLAEVYACDSARSPVASTSVRAHTP